MPSETSPKPARWTGLEARGKKVCLLNDGGFWCAFEAETPAIAEHIVLEIHTLMNSRVHAAVNSAEFNRLCRAGD